MLLWISQCAGLRDVCIQKSDENIHSVRVVFLFCHVAETSKAMTAPAIWSAAVRLYIKIWERGKKKGRALIHSIPPEITHYVTTSRFPKQQLQWIDTPSLLYPRLDSLVRVKWQTQIQSFVTFTYNCRPCVWLPLEQTEEIKSSTEAEARVTERERGESREQPPLG